MLHVLPEPEKLSLEVGTSAPWVDRVYDRKSVPGFLHFEPFEFGIFWKSQRWVPPKNIWVDEKSEVGTP